MGCGASGRRYAAGANADEERQGRKIHQLYVLDKKKLGAGNYGSVFKATQKSTGFDRAVKSMPRKTDTDLLRQEISIMKIMDHPNIIRLFETFEDHRCFYLVMELCTGGELFDRILDVGSFTEVQAAVVMKQIIQGVFYMHGLRVCHRDLKPENFLFSKKEPIEESHLKIIDFGLSCFVKEDQVLTTRSGTPYYVAPQVIAGKYDQSIDLWSIGVVMYVLLCGYPPFYGNNDEQVVAKVKLGKFSFEKADWKDISEDAKSLIRNLLKYHPRDRYNAEQALNHDWIQQKAPKATGTNLQKGFVDHLRSFRSQNKLKKAALQCIACQLGDGEIKQLRQTFMALDGNGDGLLTVDEMRDGLQQAGITETADLQQIMKDVGSGTIAYTEFLAATLDRKVYMQEEVCWRAFMEFDKDGNGKISQEELQTVLANDSLGSEFDVHAIADLLKEVDDNGDGEIDFQEFMQMMRNCH